MRKYKKYYVVLKKFGTPVEGFVSFNKYYALYDIVY